MRTFAEQIGVDARTAYKALSDAQDILNGKYTNDADFYDICTRTATGVKTAAKVGMFVCATIATAGGAAAATGSVGAAFSAGAAGSLTIGEAAGVVVGGVDCCVEIGRTGAKIILGDDHQIVKKIEESDAAQAYDTAMFIYGVATFDPKSASTGEKLLFLGDLVEKDISTYENVKVLVDESTGLIIDRIEDETRKEICVDYTRIQSENGSDLAPAATEVLGAENTGILGVDSKLNDGTIDDQLQDYTNPMNSDTFSLAKTYALVKDGIKTFSDMLNAFKQFCDEKVTYQSINPGDEGDGGGGGGGDGGAGSTDDPSGQGVTPDLPTPEYDFDDVVCTEFSDIYYKNGQKVGEVQYIIDENGRYWPKYEAWYCGNGDTLITQYYIKGNIYPQEIGGDVEAKSYGVVRSRYVEHFYSNASGAGYNYYWRDRVEYYTNGQISELQKITEGKPISIHTFSREGRLYECAYYDESGQYYDRSYKYYLSPVNGIPFDPTGHLYESRVNGNTTRYEAGGRYLDNTDTIHWGYSVYHGIGSDIDYDNYGWIEVTQTGS